MKRSAPKRRTPLKRSTQPIARRAKLRPRGPAKARREKEQRRYYRSKAYREVRALGLRRDGNRCTYSGRRNDIAAKPTFTTGIGESGKEWPLNRCSSQYLLEWHELRYPKKGEPPQVVDGVTLCRFHHHLVETIVRPWKRKRSRDT